MVITGAPPEGATGHISNAPLEGVAPAPMDLCIDMTLSLISSQPTLASRKRHLKKSSN